VFSEIEARPEGRRGRNNASRLATCCARQGAQTGPGRLQIRSERSEVVRAASAQKARRSARGRLELDAARRVDRSRRHRSATRPSPPRSDPRNASHARCHSLHKRLGRGRLRTRLHPLRVGQACLGRPLPWEVERRRPAEGRTAPKGCLQCSRKDRRPADETRQLPTPLQRIFARAQIRVVGATFRP
jgi:hypothetical protein